MKIWETEIEEIQILYKSIKGHFSDLDKELEQLIKTEDANVIMLYSRRCMEVIITDLCECELKRPRKTEPLKGIIDKLNSEEKVPEHIITSMHGLNSLATFGAHPKDFDPEQVKPVLNNLLVIIRWYLNYKNYQNISKTKSVEVKNEFKDSDVSIVTITKPKKSYILLLSGLFVVVVIVALLKFNIISVKAEKSIAVLPFQNMTNDTIWNVWEVGIPELMISYLANYEELKVRKSESINSLIQSKGLTNFASITPSVASTISQKLDAGIFVYGSIAQAGTKIRLNAQLIDSKTEEVLKSFQIEGYSNADSMFFIIDTLSAMVKNFLIISKLEKETSSDFRFFASTKSADAFRNYIYGKNAFLKGDYPTASKMLSEALRIDSNFVFATILLANSYLNQGMYDQAKKWCLKFYRERDQMPMRLKELAYWAYARYFETTNEELKILNQQLESDNPDPMTYYAVGHAYNRLYQYDKAIPYYKKSLEVYRKWDSKPMWAPTYIQLGMAYHKTGQYKKEKELYKKAKQDFPDNADIIYRQAILSLTEGDTIEANKYIGKYISIRKENSSSEADISTGLASIYSEADILEKAEEYYRQSQLLEPESPERLNNLAYFLIDKKRDINEGLKFVDKALELSPENYNYLHTKGWGLFKQDKYEEALVLLEKSDSLKPLYDHLLYLHLEEVKKAVASQKNN
jgi:tetratricopeptide (TPR) repeat protein